MEDKADKRGRPSTADSVRDVLVDALQELKGDDNKRQIFKQSSKGFKGGHLESPEEQAKFTHEMLHAHAAEVFGRMGHQMGPYSPSTQDPERIPPLEPVKNCWTTRCVACGLGGFASFKGRTYADPKKRDPMADYIITGTWIGGPATEITCAAALARKRAGQSAQMDARMDPTR